MVSNIIVGTNRDIFFNALTAIYVFRTSSKYNSSKETLELKRISPLSKKDSKGNSTSCDTNTFTNTKTNTIWHFERSLLFKETFQKTLSFAAQPYSNTNTYKNIRI